ncbi:hypothetical protein ACFFLM_08355 [Deinococcus oregonensis]|uniref:Uncharacterized protein n=1 Tax=Deinococcus oregonensis TaxID=1805970 RepID=A0ABV6AWT8_9DEIO
MTQIILTTLGMGKYKPACYQWGERPPIQTPLFSAALKGWLPEFTVKALTTPEAALSNGALLKDLIPDAVLVPISKGASDAEN